MIRAIRMLPELQMPFSVGRFPIRLRAQPTFSIQ